MDASLSARFEVFMYKGTMCLFSQQLVDDGARFMNVAMLAKVVNKTYAFEKSLGKIRR